MYLISMSAQPESTSSPAKPESERALLRSLAGGGLIASILASSCCILPLLLVSVGVGGSWMSSLTGLSPYQPLFLAISALAIGAGLWRAYRNQVACAPGTFCEVPVVTRATKVVLWTAATVSVAAVLVNIVLPYFI